VAYRIVLDPSTKIAPNHSPGSVLYHHSIFGCLRPLVEALRNLSSTDDLENGYRANPFALATSTASLLERLHSLPLLNCCSEAPALRGEDRESCGVLEYCRGSAAQNEDYSGQRSFDSRLADLFLFCIEILLFSCAVLIVRPPQGCRANYSEQLPYHPPAPSVV
jgi:hypothetical protein